MDIGTAKVGVREMADVPHHLISIRPPNQELNAWDFIQLVVEVIQQLVSRGKLPILCGGTGLYHRILREGLPDLPSADPELRKRLQKIIDGGGEGRLHGLLLAKDAKSAKRLVPTDHQRVMRALEINILTGKPVPDIKNSEFTPLIALDTLTIGLTGERPKLYNRINQRVEEMIENGLFEEVEQLLSLWGDDCRPLLEKTIGYAETLDLLAGVTTKAECVERIQRNTRRYAKRQGTWYRREPNVEWLDIFENKPLWENIPGLIKPFLDKSE
jgi:tRNA dimethylallyltransferase